MKKVIQCFKVFFKRWIQSNGLCSFWGCLECKLFKELGIGDLKPVQLNYDNQSALHIAKKNPDIHENTKHIETF